MENQPPKDGHHKTTFPSGKISSEYTIKNGEQEGLSREWYENGQLKTEMFFVRGLLSGRMRFWAEDGMLYGQKYFLAMRPVSKKKYVEECARNPELPQYEDEKIINTLGNYVRRLRRAQRQQGKQEPAPEQLRHQRWYDEECQSEVRNKTSKEALAWLTKRGGERELGDMSRRDAAKFVRKLYSLGAIKVWAANIEADVDGDQYSRRLIVKLPREKEKQGKIYNACTDAARPTLNGATAIQLGLKHMGVSLL